MASLRLFIPIFTLLLVSACSTTPMQLETVAELKQAPDNIAISKDGRIFISNHIIFRPNIKVVDLLANGTTKAFPNEQWAATNRKDGKSLSGVLGIEVDEQNRLWMLDTSKPARIVVWDIAKTMRAIFILQIYPVMPLA